MDYETILVFLANYLIHSSILFGIVFLVIKTRLFSSLRAKELLWKFALIGGFVTSFIQLSAEISFLPISTKVERVMLADPESLNSVVESRTIIFRAPIPVQSPGPEARMLIVPAYDWERISVLLIAFISLTLSIMFLWSRHRFLKGLEMILTQNAEIKRLVARLVSSLRLNSVIRVYHSRKLKSPIAYSNTKLCLPEKAVDELDFEQKNGVLAHEIAHIYRNDPAWLFWINLLTKVFFFQPLNRVMRRQIRDIMEESSDQLAVKLTGNTPAFTETLLKVARWTNQREVPYAMGLAGKSALRNRINSLLDVEGQPNRKTRPILLTLVMLIMLTFVAFVSPGISSDSTPEVMQEGATYTDEVETQEETPQSEPVTQEQLKDFDQQKDSSAIDGGQKLIQQREEVDITLLEIPKLSDKKLRGGFLRKEQQLLKSIDLNSFMPNEAIEIDNPSETPQLTIQNARAVLNGERSAWNVDYDAFKEDFWPMLLTSGLLKRRGNNTAELTYDALIVNSKRVSSRQLQPFRQLIEAHFDQDYWSSFQYKRERFKADGIKRSMSKVYTMLGSRYEGPSGLPNPNVVDNWQAYREELAETLLEDGVIKRISDNVSVKWRKGKVFINRKKFTGDDYLKYRSIKNKHFPVRAV